MYYFELDDIVPKIKIFVGKERYEFLKNKKADKIIILIDSGEMLADVGLYYNNINNDKRIGYIGVIHKLSRDITDIEEKTLLKLAETYLTNRNVNKIIGPIDRDTWSEYRCKTMTLLDNTFYGEPSENAKSSYEALNYKKKYKYFSILSNNEKKEEKIFKNITYRLVTEETLEKDIISIYNLSTDEFKNNLFYQTISKDNFIKQYTHLFYTLKPIIMVAEQNNNIIGFMLGFKGDNCIGNEKTFVMKTIAVKTDFRGSGIGSELYKRVANIAFDNGYTRLIGALIHENNISYKITEKYSPKIISEYALYEKEVNNNGFI